MSLSIQRFASNSRLHNIAYHRLQTSTVTMSAKWFDHLPKPVSKPAEMSVVELHERMRGGECGKDFVVVDVRRTDIEVKGF
jgi:hypothetical protein